MGLTTILTTIWVCPPNPCKCGILIFKENWTPPDILGHAADVWGSRGREFKSRQPDQTIHSIRTKSDLHSTDITAIDDAERRPPRQPRTTGPKPTPSVQYGFYIGMQVASRDRRILMAGDPLQDVQIDTGVGHPCQGGVRLAEAD